MDGDLEFGIDSETVTKSHGSQSIRKNISLKLKQNTAGNNDAPKSLKREKRPSGTKSVGSKGGGGGGHVQSKGQSFSIENLQKSKVVKIDNKVNLIGEKVVDPLIHTCEKCLLPILIYGRLMPCKHVFCFSCAKKYDNNCLRCSAKITRIEQSALGTVFVCTVGGSKHGVSGCQRTYLSQRDLQSHIQHRHVNQRGIMTQQQHMPSMQEQLIQAGTMQQQAQQQQHTMLLGPNVMHPPPTNVPPPSMDFLGQMPPTSMQYVPAQQIYLSRPPPQQQPPMMMTGPPPGSHMINMPVQPMMIQQQQQQDHRMGVSAPQQQQQQSIVVMASRSTNLITVPIQDENFHNQSMQQFQQDHYNHQAAGNQFVMQQQQTQQQQQQQQAAQQQAQQQNQQQITLQQAQFVIGQPQLMNRSNLIGQGHLRPQNAPGSQMVNPQMVPTQMNIHAYQRFDDPNQHAQFMSAPQGVSNNSWLSNQMAQQQRPPSAGTNQQIQYF